VDDGGAAAAAAAAGVQGQKQSREHGSAAIVNAGLLAPAGDESSMSQASGIVEEDKTHENMMLPGPAGNTAAAWVCVITIHHS
jgi:hypothetical protein